MSDRFFDQTTPNDLFRAQTFKEEKAGLSIVYPNPGFERKNAGPRPPDVEVFEVNGEAWVRGCRTTRGDFRGVSMYDRVNPRFKGGRWYKWEADKKIPPVLAVLQDGKLSEEFETHFTIAPKDDMPMALFEVWLNAISIELVPVE